MPRRKEIQNAIGIELYNVQINPKEFAFGPNEPFVKWAAVAVPNFHSIPNGLGTLEIPEGLYAVFHYKGSQTNVAAFFNSIYTQWMLSSDYELDSRPQFEILGKRYKNNDPNSEEEIWIPIKSRMK